MALRLGITGVDQRLFDFQINHVDPPHSELNASRQTQPLQLIFIDLQWCGNIIYFWVKDYNLKLELMHT